MPQPQIIIVGENRVVESWPSKTYWNPYMFVSEVEELEAKGIFDLDGYMHSYDGFLLGKCDGEYLIDVHRTDELNNWEQRGFDEKCLDPILRHAVKEWVIIHVGIKDGKWRAYIEMVCPYFPSMHRLPLAAGIH